MQLLLLYGPPTSGKATIAEELQRLTGFKFLENKFTNVPVLKVFTFGSKPFDNIVMNMRINIYEEAAKNNIDLITTLVYAKETDDEFIQRILESVEINGGSVGFVKVTCTREILFKRIGEWSREDHDKLMGANTLRNIMINSDVEADIPFRDSYVVDITTVSAAENAGKIRDVLRSS